MVYPEIMDGRSSGQGVYVIRRILAVLVILLLLALLVPQAYQALLGPRDEAGSGPQETADVGSSGIDGSHEEGAVNGETASVADEVAEKEDTSDNPSYIGDTGVSESAARMSRGLETSEDEYGGEESIELDADLVGVAAVLDEVALREVDHTVPTPVIDAGGQQFLQPILTAEPIVPVNLLAAVEPIIVEDTILPQDSTYYDYPIYYEDPYPVYYEYPTYYDYAAYYEDPAYYDYAVYYEEQVFVDSDTLDTTYNTAAVTVSAQEDGGATAYAAAEGGAGAYAAISTG
jgi:hypothetical protein